MSTANGTAQEVSSQDFLSRYPAIEALILKEWPSLEKDKLSQTEGDLDKVVTYVSGALEKTTQTVRKQLGELYELAGNGQSGKSKVPSMNQIKGFIRKFETRAQDTVKSVRTDLLPKAEQKVKDNIWVALLVAVGLGFILGFLTHLAGARRGGKGE